MKKIILSIILLITIFIIIIAYLLGHKNGEQHCEKILTRPVEYWKQLAELDKSFLANIKTRSNQIKTGTYIFKINFPDKAIQTYQIKLVLIKGELKKAPNPNKNKFVIHELTQKANVISWVQSDPDEKPSAYYVGLIDGTMAWGKVYIPGSYGWHQLPPSIGVWQIYPKKINTR